MKAPLTVAMFGLSGVGKGWIARQVCLSRPDVLHLEASALMRQALAATAETLRKAEAGVLRNNQATLVEAFGAVRAAQPHRPVLFDGHSVIDNDTGLVDIPMEIIAGLHPDVIVFVEDDAVLIANRRGEDTRVRPQRSAQVLAQHQERAREVARGYAASLGLPFVPVTSGDWPRVQDLFDQPSTAVSAN